MEKKPVLAWHFVGETLRDGRPVPKDRVWLEHKGPVKICKTGLHASRNPFDALQYALGNTLCLVEVDEIEDEHYDKLVCRRRRIIARMDATELVNARAAARDAAKNKFTQLVYECFEDYL